MTEIPWWGAIGESEQALAQEQLQDTEATFRSESFRICYLFFIAQGSCSS